MAVNGGGGGDDYEGEWSADAPHGFGSYLYRATGARYTGHFKDGQYHGSGTYTSAEGQVTEGAAPVVDKGRARQSRRRARKAMEAAAQAADDDLLEKVLSFLPGRDLAAIETVCTHFRYGGWLAANKAPMPEVSAKRKLDALELGDMPPGFKYVVLVSHYP